MADVDITSLSVEISAESSGAELNIDKLATAISNLRAKGNVTKVVNSLDKLSASISTLKQASSALDGLDRLQNFLGGLGNLNVSGSVKSLNSVVNAIKKIPAAVSGLGGVDFYSMSGSITELTNALAPLSILDASGLKAIGSAVNAIGKIPDLSEKLKAADLDAFTASCQKISAALTPLASQLDKVGNAFAKLPPQMSKVVTQANRVAAANQKAGKSYLSLSSQMSSFVKRAAQLVSLKAIANYIGQAVVKFNDYYEAANLFGVSMKNLTSESSDFISKMETLLGIDPTEAMNNMATIQSLTTSFGMASDKAYVLSKNLTQLGYDLASLKNIPVAESFTKIQAAISGELEPIRRLGVDLSQARLQQELLALGFTQSVSSLSQADKAVLRYIAIMKQTTDAQGDFARTIGGPANQIRVLQAQLESLARSVGSLLYPALSSILPPLIAAVELVKELVQWIAKLMGVKVEFPDFSGAASNVGDVSDALDDTTDSTKKAAKALKNYTMGFDELNIIDPTQGSSGSGSGSGTTGNILGDVDLSGYDMFKDYVGSSVDEIKAKLESMKGVIAAIGIALAGLSLAKFLTDVSNAIAKMSELQKLALTIATVVIEAALVFQFSKDYASSGNPIDLLGEIVSAAFGSFVLWKTIGADGISLGMGVAFVASLAGLTYALGTRSASLGDASTWIQALLTTAFGSVAGITLLSNLGIAAGTAATLSIGLAGLLTFTGITFSVGENLQNYPVLDKIISAIMAIFGGVAGAGVALLVGASLPVAGALAAAGVGIGLVLHWAGIKWGKKDGDEETDASKEANEKMAALESVFEEKIENIKQIIVDKWNSAIDFMTSLPGKIGDIINNIEEWFASLPEKIGYALGLAVGIIVQWVGNMVDTAISEVPKIISSIGKFFDEVPGKVWSAILKAVDTISDWRKEMVAYVVIEVPKIVESFVDEFKKIPDKLKALGQYIWEGFINGLKEKYDIVTNALKSFTDGFINGFTRAFDIHSPSKLFEQFGIYIDQGLANGIIGALGYVENATNQLIDATAQAGKDFVNKGIDYGTGFVNNIITGLDNNWEQLNSSLQNDFFGTVQTFIEAAQGGDWKTVGTTIAATIWGAMGEEQRNQIKTVASDLISRLGKALSSAASSLFDTAAKLSKNIVSGISNNFGEAVSKVQSMVGNITSVFEDSKAPLSSAALAISQGLKGGLLSQFPKMLTGVAGLITTIGASFTAMLEAIGSTLSALGIPTGFAMIAGGVAIAAAIAGIVASIGGTSGSSSDYTDSSNYVGSPSYDSSSSSYGGSYYSGSSGNSEDTRDAVYNGCYNAFLDIMQRYGEQLLQGQEIKVYLDGKQLTASVEKTQKDRGIPVMGTEVYSY